MHWKKFKSQSLSAFIAWYTQISWARLALTREQTALKIINKSSLPQKYDFSCEQLPVAHLIILKSFKLKNIMVLKIIISIKSFQKYKATYQHLFAFKIELDFKITL